MEHYDDRVHLSERERDVLCLCCAFSAVLAGFRHALSYEAWRENLSHGAIMTNPPTHTLLPFLPFHPPLCADSAPFFPLSIHSLKAGCRGCVQLFNQRSKNFQSCEVG